MMSVAEQVLGCEKLIGFGLGLLIGVGIGMVLMAILQIGRAARAEEETEESAR